MRRTLRSIITVGLAVGATLSVAIAVAADYYKLNWIKRIEQDLYKTRDGFYVQTKYCYHYTYGEDALLKWEGPYGDNKVIWEDDSTCDVKNFWRK